MALTEVQHWPMDTLCERPRDVCRCGHVRDIHDDVQGCRACVQYSSMDPICVQFRLTPRIRGVKPK